ncbi:MAG TPA: hypothetical protein VMV69_07930 [Pirellulales bacterium]|nr:hypothetical protein [Pirellulales bacterium]
MPRHFSQANPWATPIPSDVVSERAARWAGALMGLAVCIAGGVLAARRFAGALTVSLEGAVLVAVATAAALAAAWARFAWLRGRPGGASVWLDRAVLVSPTAGILLLGYGLSPPDAGFWVKALLWTLLVAEEATSGWWVLGRGRATWRRRPRAGASLWPRRCPLGEQLTQRLSRSKTADGCERLRGSSRADFAPGSRAARIHVAFCPPFASLPRFEFRQSAGPPSRIALGQLLPHGARLELKLADPAREAAAVWVEFSASG